MTLRLTAPLILGVALLACSGRSASSPRLAPGSGTRADADADNASDTDTDADADSDAGADAKEQPLNLQLAKRMIIDVEKQWPCTANRSLRTPRSLADVEKILKLDQITFFGSGVDLARTLTDVKALALEAQIELAWGEAYLVLLEIMLRLNEHFEGQAAVLSERRDVESSEDEELRSLHQAVSHTKRLADAFQLLSIEHSTLGSAQADNLIKEHPDSYLGYRVAADFYRMVHDWKRFQEMVGKIEQLNPNSNGLVFLRGAAAYHKDGDSEAASVWFRKALYNDPDFVRAQVHLMMIQNDIAGTHAEYQALKKLNPDHQIVHWAGDIIERAYQLPQPRQTIGGR